MLPTCYDAHGVHSLVVRKSETVEEQLESAEAAPSTFVASLWMLVRSPPNESLLQQRTTLIAVPLRFDLTLGQSFTCTACAYSCI